MLSEESGKVWWVTDIIQPSIKSCSFRIISYKIAIDSSFEEWDIDMDGDKNTEVLTSKRN